MATAQAGSKWFGSQSRNPGIRNQSVEPLPPKINKKIIFSFLYVFPDKSDLNAVLNLDRYFQKLEKKIIFSLLFVFPDNIDLNAVFNLVLLEPVLVLAKKFSSNLFSFSKLKPCSKLALYRFPKLIPKHFFEIQNVVPEKTLNLVCNLTKKKPFDFLFKRFALYEAGFQLFSKLILRNP